MRDLALEQRVRDAIAAAFANAGAPSQAAVARLLEVDRQTVSVYAKGEQIPRLDAAVQVAEGLGITLDQLAGREPLPDRPPGAAELAWQLREVSATQSDLVTALLGIARDVARLGGQAPGASGTG